MLVLDVGKIGLGLFSVSYNGLTGKNCVLVNSVQEWLLGWPISSVYTINQVLNIPLHVLGEQMFEKCDSSNRQQKGMVTPFVLILENLFP